MIKYPTESIYKGELLEFERKTLFDTIIKYQPKICLEIGTGNGGGSTFYIANALYQLNNNGILYTCDPVYNDASIIFQNTLYENIVKFFHLPSTFVIQLLINGNIKPDFIFFDGPEDPNIALEDFQKIENSINKGCVFMMHDWDTRPRIDGNLSTKALLLKPYIHQ